MSDEPGNDPSGDPWNAPIDLDIAATAEELAEQRNSTVLTAVYAKSVAERLPGVSAEAAAVRAAAEAHIRHIDMLLAPGHARSLQDEFLLSDMRDEVSAKAATLVISVAQKGPRPG